LIKTIKGICYENITSNIIGNAPPLAGLLFF